MQNIFQSLTNIYGLFSKESKKNFLRLFIFVFLMGILDLIGVGLMVPVISIASGKGEYITLLQNLEISNSMLLASVVFVFCFKNLYTIYVLRRLGKFSFAQVGEIREKLYDIYTSQSYSEALLEHTSIKVKNIGENSDRLGRVIVTSFVLLLSEYILLSLLFMYMCILLPILFIFQVFLGGILMFVIMSLIKKNIKRWGGEVNKSYGNVIKIGKEHIEGSRELKVYGAFDIFKKRYRKEVDKNALNQALFFSWQHVPRLILEVAIVLMLVLLTFFVDQGKISFDDIILFGVVLLRLYPTTTRILSYTNAINFGDSIVKEILKILQYKEQEFPVSKNINAKSQYDNCIVLSEVTFSYPGSERVIFDKFSLIIKKGFTGIIGASGSGKSTLLDIVIGAVPAEGVIYQSESNDIKYIHNSNLSYVAQKPHIFYGTVADNIALGASEEEIDVDRIWHILRILELDELVSKMKLGINENLRENASLLSGGQVQRIAIGRALYNQPDILIMDEATSALDKKIERKIMDWIIFESGIDYVIMSAHNVSSLKNVNDIVFLDNGAIMYQGEWDKFKSTHKDFLNPF